MALWHLIKGAPVPEDEVDGALNEAVLEVVTASVVI
jgi:hypothetical protein